jgi:hypothetical protein
MVNSCDQSLCSWAEDGLSFVVADPDDLAAKIIPQYFKHNKFLSFVRQLNFYGFRKIKLDPIKISLEQIDMDGKYWHFKHDKFRRGRPDMLWEVRKANQAAAALQGVTHPEFYAMKLEMSLLQQEVGALRDEMRNLVSVVEAVARSRKRELHFVRSAGSGSGLLQMQAQQQRNSNNNTKRSRSTSTSEAPPLHQVLHNNNPILLHPAMVFMQNRHQHVRLVNQNANLVQQQQANVSAWNTNNNKNESGSGAGGTIDRNMQYDDSEPAPIIESSSMQQQDNADFAQQQQQQANVFDLNTNNKKCGSGSGGGTIDRNMQCDDSEPAPIIESSSMQQQDNADLAQQQQQQANVFHLNTNNNTCRS